MVSMNRIAEAYSYYVFREPTNEQDSIKKFTTLRDRLKRILESKKIRSIQLAMGSDMLPFQNVINKMSNRDFDEFIDENITGKRRKHIFNKY